MLGTGDGGLRESLCCESNCFVCCVQCSLCFAAGGCVLKPLYLMRGLLGILTGKTILTMAVFYAVKLCKIYWFGIAQHSNSMWNDVV